VNVRSFQTVKSVSASGVVTSAVGQSRPDERLGVDYSGEDWAVLVHAKRRDFVPTAACSRGQSAIRQALPRQQQRCQMLLPLLQPAAPPAPTPAHGLSDGSISLLNSIPEPNRIQTSSRTVQLRLLTV